GRLYKNLRALIRSVSLLPFSGWELKLIGDGPEATELREYCQQLGLSDQVCILPYTTNPYGLMKEADIFCSPSLWEGFPNVVLEAIYCGCRVVANDADGGGLRYIQSLTKGVVVCDYSKPEEVAQKITE